jgi:hypothetical protein
MNATQVFCYVLHKVLSDGEDWVQKSPPSASSRTLGPCAARAL